MIGRRGNLTLRIEKKKKKKGDTKLGNGQNANLQYDFDAIVEATLKKDLPKHQSTMTI